MVSDDDVESLASEVSDTLARGEELSPELRERVRAVLARAREPVPAPLNIEFDATELADAAVSFQESVATLGAVIGEGRTFISTADAVRYAAAHNGRAHHGRR